MLQTARSDPAEFRVVAEVLAHRLHWAHRRAVEEEPPAEEAAPEAEAGRSLAERLSGGQCVWVLSPALAAAEAGQRRGPPQHPVDMQSPPLSLIYLHSTALGDTIKALLVYWDELGLRPPQRGGARPSVMPEGVRLLPGEYDVWQEVLRCAALYCGT